MTYQGITIGSEVIIPLRDRTGNTIKQNRAFVPVLARVLRIHADRLHLDAIDPFNVTYKFVPIRNTEAKNNVLGQQYYINMNIHAQQILTAYYNGQSLAHGITAEQSIAYIAPMNQTVAYATMPSIPPRNGYGSAFSPQGPDTKSAHNATTEVTIALRTKSGKIIRNGKHAVQVTATIVKRHANYSEVVDDIGNSHQVPNWEIQLVLTDRDGKYFYDYMGVNEVADKVYKKYYDNKNNDKKDNDKKDDDK
jgi:hypothetical protein